MCILGRHNSIHHTSLNSFSELLAFDLMPGNSEGGGPSEPSRADGHVFKWTVYPMELPE